MRISDPFVWIIRGYQRMISRYTPAMCRFEPSCSHYAITSFQRHGILRGAWLASARLMRCTPFHPGGYDPVPKMIGASAHGRGAYRSGDSGE